MRSFRLHEVIALIDQRVVRDIGAGDDSRLRGIEIDDAFHPVSDDPPAARLCCHSILFILERHSFVQGITSSQEMGNVVGVELARTIASAERTA